MERHRLQRLYLDENPSLIEGKDVLHFAPESFARLYISERALSYIGGDLNPAPGDVFVNIEAMHFPDDSFDLVICNHVLEHVDDKKALAELRRVLRPSGTLLLMFPIIEGWATTYENPDVLTPQARLAHFGQEDHVRYFGADVRDRIRTAGFRLAEFTAEEPLVCKFGLLRGEKLFVCGGAL
ncbi:class I SAM-dependent methyltransferase [Mesorhizobium delmotii]|nr:class I SAM-dependent methyltransferase [Mesorhizobium delmotii]